MVLTTPKSKSEIHNHWHHLVMSPSPFQRLFLYWSERVERSCFTIAIYCGLQWREELYRMLGCNNNSRLKSKHWHLILREPVPPIQKISDGSAMRFCDFFSPLQSPLVVNVKALKVFGLSWKTGRFVKWKIASLKAEGTVSEQIDQERLAGRHFHDAQKDEITHSFGIQTFFHELH